MSLQLDARQRAMLQEMGITIWQAAPAAAAAAPSVTERMARPAAQGMPVLERPLAPQVPPAQPRSEAPAPVARQQPPQAAPAPAPAATQPPGASEGAVARLHAPVALYPDAATATSGPPRERGNGWLVIFETPTPADPLGGDSGRLLDNMLRAMQLHRHPRTFACVLERGAGAEASPPVQAMLSRTLAELQPSMVLILGLGAARATLDNREPLGRLRAAQHQMPDGTPAFVSYDPAYLLRAPDAKASAWADLCRALAVVRKAGEA